MVAFAPGPGSDKRVRVRYSNIRGLHANLNKLSVAGSEYDVLVYTESKVSDRLEGLFIARAYRSPEVATPRSSVWIT